MCHEIVIQSGTCGGTVNGERSKRFSGNDDGPGSIVSNCGGRGLADETREIAGGGIERERG